MAKQPRESTERSKKFVALKADALAWLQSMRFSALSLLLLLVVAAAAIILTPNISVFVQQQKELTELRESVALHEKAVAEAESTKIKWKDPVYIRARARERLFYVMPGQTQLSVLTDGVEVPVDEERHISDTIEPITRQWQADIVKSVLVAGTTDADPQDLTEY